jgi:hypothetical protein
MLAAGIVMPKGLGWRRRSNNSGPDVYSPPSDRPSPGGLAVGETEG